MWLQPVLVTAHVMYCMVQEMSAPCKLVTPARRLRRVGRRKREGKEEGGGGRADASDERRDLDVMPRPPNLAPDLYTPS